MARFPATGFQKDRAEKAFRFYAEVDANGKRRSNNAIAQMVGVSASAVAFWKSRDHWDSKIVADAAADLTEADTTNRALNKLLREGLLQHIKTLSQIVAYSKSDTDKIAAIKAFVHVAKELGVLAPGTNAAELAPPTSFKDDIPHGKANDYGSGEGGPAGEDQPAGGEDRATGESASVQPVPADLHGLSSADDSVDQLSDAFRSAGL